MRSAQVKFSFIISMYEFYVTSTNYVHTPNSSLPDTLRTTTSMFISTGLRLRLFSCTRSLIFVRKENYVSRMRDSTWVRVFCFTQGEGRKAESR